MVFVTGGTGFVGREVVRQLVAAGHGVRCLVRAGGRGSPPGTEGWEGTLNDRERLTRGMADCRAVIHLVGIIREAPGHTFEEVHVRGTKAVLDAAREAGVPRIVHMSALGARSDAASRYHRTKWYAEELVRQSGLRFTIFRPSVIFGPEDEFVNMLADMIRKAPVVPVIGSGKYGLQPVFAGDVAEGFVRGLDAGEDRAFEVGGPASFSYEEMLGEIMSRLGRSRPIVHIPAGAVRGLLSLAELLRLPLPITRDQLTMLLEGNTCDPLPFTRFLGRPLKSFRAGISEYLGRA